MLLVYGPLAQWFVAADRLLYDILAGAMPAEPLDNAIIVSIDPQRVGASEVLNQYGAVLQELQERGAARIIMARPPEFRQASP